MFNSMRKLLLLLTLCMATLCASAAIIYVQPNGSNSNDGSSWATAKKTIAGGFEAATAGDEIQVAEGIYYEQVSLPDGVALKGGYNAATGERDIDKYETILDASNLASNSYFIVKYTAYPTSPILLEGFTIQNSNSSAWGTGTMFMRGNMTVNRCYFRNCKSTNADAGAGAIFMENDAAPNAPVVSNCIFEMCEGIKGAAIYNSNDHGIIENCIFRGCKGTRAVVRVYKAGGIMRNCLLYNNTLIETGAKGAIENNGTVINCTVCNNYSNEYAGIYTSSGGKTYNCVFWGNKSAENFTEKPNYLSSSSAAAGNVADIGTSSSKFISTKLAADNYAEGGPNFGNPTAFIGVPTNNSEILAMQYADFSLSAGSAALLDLGDAAQAPATDIIGVARPIGAGVDVGAYEYDPNAPAVPVQGIIIVQDTMVIAYDASEAAAVLFKPANATDKQLVWSIDNPAVATVNNGLVSGVAVGTTVVRAQTPDGLYKDTAVVVIRDRVFPNEVLAADANYHMEDYTVPSFIEFLVAKEAARLDSLDYTAAERAKLFTPLLATLAEKIANLQAKEEPYNQIATFNGDPKSCMGFCWFTNGGITNGKVQVLAKANASAEDFEAGTGVLEYDANTADAQLHYTPIQETESPKYDICTAAGLPRNTKFNYVSHKANATNLNPGTVYSWRVGFAGHWSEIAQFVTQDANQGDFSFVYMTDSHIQDAEYIEQANLCAKALVKNEPDVKFCLFPGDFVDTGGKTNSEWQWERWFEGSMRPMLNAMAVVPTDGNHDDSPSLNYDYHFNTDWGFANGASVKPQFKGITYSFQYGDVLFLVFSMQDWWRENGTSESQMHSAYFTTDIRNWFKEQIAAHPTAKYRVTLSHKNVFSGAGHHTDDECTLIRTLMLPIMKECEIDLAIQGHDHCYEVIGPVDPDTKTVVEGSVTDTVRVAPEATGRWERSENKTGLEGGTFTTDDGTLYFIGATCGRKRYEPYNRETMEAEYTTDPNLLFDYNHHNVENLFDLFTSKFGQPGSPSYTRFNVTSEGLEVITYKTDAAGNKTEYNTIYVKRTKPHTFFEGIENIPVENMREGEKFIRDGQIYILKNGVIYNVIGQKIAQ